MSDTTNSEPNPDLADPQPEIPPAPEPAPTADETDPDDVEIV